MFYNPDLCPFTLEQTLMHNINTIIFISSGKNQKLQNKAYVAVLHITATVETTAVTISHTGLTLPHFFAYHLHWHMLWSF